MAALLLGIAGCRNESSPPLPNSTDAVNAMDREAVVTNAFGMKFSRIEIDSGRNLAATALIPRETYYLQQTEVGGKHLDQLRAFAKRHNIGPDGYLNISTSEWRDHSDLARLMSNIDPNYDYRLPTKVEWMFACMNGYEQSCDHDGANAFGMTGMLDGNVECVGEASVLMGRWIENWSGIYDGHEKPACECEYWTRCNPDGDDSLNEMIEARFVVVPKSSSE